MSRDPALRIILIDDDDDVRRTLGAHLRAQGHQTRVVASGAQGLQLLREAAADVVITDVMMAPMSGLEVLRQVVAEWPDTDVVVITAYGDVEGAVAAMRAGAFDYFTKPYQVHAISACLRRTARFQALRRENRRIRRRLEATQAWGRRQFGLDSLVGASPGLEVVRQQIRQVAATPDTTVLVTGETGTGKELVARAIHYESDRAAGPFVPVDCTAIPASLSESHIFGHVKGAFTDARQDRAGLIEQAEGGTLFLDEIGDMEPLLQARFLRVLEERQLRRVGGDRVVSVDVRVVSATHQDLRQAVAAGTFRRDLLYRLQAYRIDVPPLRQRPEDILVLARHFLQRFRRDLRRSVEGFIPAAEAALLNHPFPGNVRELKNAVEGAVIRCAGDRIGITDLDLHEEAVPATGTAAVQPSAIAEPGTGDLAAATAPAISVADLDLTDMERRLVREAMRRARGNRTRAAALLGISRDALRRRLSRLGIDTDD